MSEQCGCDASCADAGAIAQVGCCICHNNELTKRGCHCGMCWGFHAQIVSKTPLKYTWLMANGTTKSMARTGKAPLARVDQIYRLTVWPDSAAMLY